MKFDLNSFWSFMASLDWLKILPIVISLLTMFGGLYIYLRHDNAIKKLQKHHSIVKIGNKRHIYMRDKAFWELVQDMNES